MNPAENKSVSRPSASERRDPGPQAISRFRESCAGSRVSFRLRSTRPGHGGIQGVSMHLKIGGPVIAGIVLTLSPAAAQTPAAFYKGRNVDLYIGYSVG